MRNGTHGTHRIVLSFGLALCLVFVVLVSVTLLAGTGLLPRGPTQVSAAPAAPVDELHVCATCAYTNVQAAVDAAYPGDIIKVAAGTYTGVHARAVPPDYPYPSASGLITQVVFISKTIVLRGGYTTTNWVVYDPQANLTTIDAQGLGRAFVIAGDISPTLEGLRITGGDGAGLGGEVYTTGGGGGGGIYVLAATSTISDNEIVGNTARSGGGFYLAYSAATLNNNRVISNTASAYGGGLSLHTSPATLSGNAIISNTAQGYMGGGLNVEQSAATLVGNTIAGNETTGSTSSFGGGGLRLHLSDAATIRGNTVTSNSTRASSGGGLYLFGSEGITVSGNTISANTAGQDAGGLEINQCDDAIFSGNTVVSNTARRNGGGLDLFQNDSAMFSGNVVISNSADYGGGLYMDRESNDDLNIWTNTVIADNRASTAGSGIYMQWSSPRMVHTTVARNNGGDGSGIHIATYLTFQSTMALTNTVLVSHTVGVTVTANNAAILSGVLWHGNSANTGGAGTVTVTSAYTGTPAFAADGYHLGPGSAAIDQGVDAGVDVDIDLDLRPIGGSFDLGADEAPLFLTATPAASASLVYTDPQGSPTTLAVPAGAVTTTTTIQVAPKGSQSVTGVPPGLAYAGHALDLDAYQNGDPIPSFTFESAISLTIEYSDADVVGLSEGTLALYRWTGSAWEEIGTRPGESSILDTGANRLTAFLLSLSRFSLFGTTAADVPIVGLSATNDSPTEVGNATTFTATVITGTNVAYTWVFGDGGMGNGAVVTHVYTSTGRYTAAVSAINSASGVTATTPVSITVNVVVGPGLAGTLVYTDTQDNPTILDIPPDAVSETTTIAFTPLETVPVSPGLTSAGHSFDLSAYRDDAGGSLLIPGFAFQEAATLTVKYSDADVARIDESTLALYRYWTEGTLRFWERVGVRPGESQTLDEDGNVMTAWILGLSQWRGMGEGAEHWVFLPVVLREN